jgi:hypothetical protein
MINPGSRCPAKGKQCKQFVGTLYKDKDKSDSWCENITV